MYGLSYKQLLDDLYRAYYDARRHKCGRAYQQRFERHADTLLAELCHDLYYRHYEARPSSCFTITDPKKREVFAADFRDRIVHHLYYNYTHRLFERTFVADTYSCIKGRGTHFGIARLQTQIRRASRNYAVPCFVLKMDIRGYFMHIDRQKLLDICLQTIDAMAGHKVQRCTPQRWCDVLDIEFVKYLTREIVLLDPLSNCRIVGRPSDWDDLPPNKSLFNSPAGCGLPIGNLTSQLFSNVYLNRLDQYMKRTLHCRYYGRYVDDFYVVDTDKQRLHRIVGLVRTWLADELGLTLHEGKVVIRNVRYGVDFLGACVRPYRIEASAQSLRRMRPKIDKLCNAVNVNNRTREQVEHVRASVNSYCGVLMHGKNYHLRKELLGNKNKLRRIGYFDAAYAHFKPYGDLSYQAPDPPAYRQAGHTFGRQA